MAIGDADERIYHMAHEIQKQLAHAKIDERIFLLWLQKPDIDPDKKPPFQQFLSDQKEALYTYAARLRREKHLAWTGRNQMLVNVAAIDIVETDQDKILYHRGEGTQTLEKRESGFFLGTRRIRPYSIPDTIKTMTDLAKFVEDNKTTVDFCNAVVMEAMDEFGPTWRQRGATYLFAGTRLKSAFKEKDCFSTLDWWVPPGKPADSEDGHYQKGWILIDDQPIPRYLLVLACW